MKWSYVLLGDAANETSGKFNLLGGGVRVIAPSKLPALTPVVFLAGVEASADEVGDHQFKLTLESPDGKRAVLVDDTAKAVERPAAEAELPIELRFQVSFPLVALVEGRYFLRVQVGKLRTTYAYIVVVKGDADEGPS